MVGSPSWSQRPTLQRKHFVAAELTFLQVSFGSLGQSGLPLYVSALARPHAVDVDDVHTLLSSWVVHPSGHELQPQVELVLLGDGAEVGQVGLEVGVENGSLS